MAMQRKFLKHARSIAGTVLVALGIFILHQDLDRAAAQLSHLLGIPGDAPGAFPTVILAVLRLVQAYAADHHRFLQGFLHQVLASSWPVVLVVAGTVLSRNASPEEGETPPKEICHLVDLTGGRSTLE
jgi:hypothetical protein